MDVSMRPSAAAKLDQAGTAAAEEKGFLPGQPSWSNSTTTWGLRAYPKGGAGGPVDVYLGGGENRAGDFHRAFDQAREDVARARHSQSKRGTHASATLTRTLNNFSHRNAGATQSLHKAPGADRYVGGGPKCRAHTKEFCVPSLDTHKVYMGYVDPVDLAQSMTADGLCDFAPFFWPPFRLTFRSLLPHFWEQQCAWRQPPFDRPAGRDAQSRLT